VLLLLAAEGGRVSELEQVEILLVEDNAEDAEMTMRALRKRNLANRLHWVKDGEEALDYLFCSGQYAGRSPGHAPRLVLLDIKMPKVDGIEVLRRVKGSELRTIPVVVMTSSNEERDVLESYRLGVNSYIVKPVQFEAFIETVSKIGLYWLLTNRVPTK
jgi:two-component system, response regulator